MFIEYSSDKQWFWSDCAYMRRLIWAFAGRTYHIAGNLMSRLIYPNIWAWPNFYYDEILSAKTTLTFMQDNQTLMHANNKCTDQPAHPRSLIKLFVGSSIEGIIATY